MQAELFAQIDDLFPEQTVPRLQLVPTSGNDSSGNVLAAIPAKLNVVGSDGPTDQVLTTTNVALVTGWTAIVAGVIAAGIILRSSICFGERRERFASAVTHELRTPLTTFQLYTEMLADGIIRDDAKRQSYLKTLKQESSRLSGLVENVLAYARVEQGRTMTRQETIRVDELRQRLEQELERRFRRADLRWSQEWRGDPTENVVVDVEAVTQILLNLVDNACKYAHEGEQSSVRLRVSIDDRELSFVLADNGPGIDKDSQRRIFAPFDRANHNNHSKPGVGLGLAFSRQLARQMNGSLKLLAGPDRGACFALRLPRVRL